MVNNPCFHYFPRTIGCALHVRCRQHDAVQRGDAKCISECPDFVAYTKDDAKCIITQSSTGIGDALLGSLAVAAIDHPKKIYAVGQPAIRFLQLFRGVGTIVATDLNIQENPDDTHFDINAGYEKECATKSEVPRWIRYCRNCQVTTPVIPSLHNHERIAKAGKRYAGSVVFAPFSYFNCRQWPIVHWVVLEQKLIQAGIRVIISHDNAKQCGLFLSEKVCSSDPEVLAGMMLNAACVISNDSGLAHLSGILGTRTFVLTGPTNAIRIYGAYPRATGIKSTLYCAGCYWNEPYNSSCDLGCSALWSVSPQSVFETILAGFRFSANCS